MNLFELYGIKDYREKEHIDDISDILSKYGFDLLDRGNYGSVYEYQKNKDFVLKVFSVYDVAFKAFVDYCKQHPDNPCLPRYRGNSIKINDAYRAIRMERLTPIYNLWYGLTGSRLGQSRYIPENFPEEYKNIIDTLKDIRQKLPFELDIKSNNFMKRGNQIVIIDPVQPILRPGPSKRYGLKESQYELTNDQVCDWADDIRLKYGLKFFNVALDRRYPDVLCLQMIEVTDKKQGTGTKAMKALCEYADDHNLRIILSPALRDDNKGTTSRARLINFYKRFGFVQNRGRNKDFSISEAMYRLPIEKRREL